MSNKKINKIQKKLQSSSDNIKNLTSIIPEIEGAINVIIKCLMRGNKIILFGNGGSAADAEHIAAEFIGRFKHNRRSFPALALTGNSSSLTAISNDYSYDLVFSRQCEGLVVKNDVVIGISTSGDSYNVKRGLIVSKRLGAKTIGLLGKKGTIRNVVDIALCVNSNLTPEIQEAHRVIYHIICEQVEKNLKNKTNKRV